LRKILNCPRQMSNDIPWFGEEYSHAPKGQTTKWK
jgi:hypothetical protein